MYDGEFDEGLIDTEASEDEIPEGFHDVEEVEPESDF